MALEQAVRKLTLIERDTGIAIALFVLLCGVITGSWESSLSLAAGGVLMLANFHFLWRFSKGVVEHTDKNKKRFLFGLFFLCIGMLAVAAFVLIYLKAPILPFFAGTLSLLAAIFVRGIFFP